MSIVYSEGRNVIFENTYENDKTRITNEIAKCSENLDLFKNEYENDKTEINNEITKWSENFDLFKKEYEKECENDKKIIDRHNIELHDILCKKIPEFEARNESLSYFVSALMITTVISLSLNIGTLIYILILN